MINEKIIQNLQELKNEYKLCLFNRNPLCGINKMWEIGDLLLNQGITNPHSVGWEIQNKKVYLTRAFIFRCFVIRRCWSTVIKLNADLYNIKSVNSVIEFIPLIDQNDKWKVPQSEISNLFSLLNTKSANIFNKELIRVKQKYIGIDNNRNKYLTDYAPLKSKINAYLKTLIELSNSKELFLERGKFIGINKIKLMSDLLVALALGKDIDPKIIELQDNDDFSLIFNELLEIKNNKIKSKRLLRIINPNEFIDYANLFLAMTSQEQYDKFLFNRRFKLNL